jgi:GNAT superfamily N-acetyltransferase
MSLGGEIGGERSSSVMRLRALEEADATAFEEAFAEMGWNKPAAQFIQYFREQEAGDRTVLVAEWEGAIAGYVTILWESGDPLFSARGVPEIKDFNVLSKCRRRGIGSALMDAAEGLVGKRSSVVGLGVGLHPGYGSAQRLYVRRGYVPDGAGVVVEGNAVPEGSEIRLDDGPMLRMMKDLE